MKTILVLFFVGAVLGLPRPDHPPPVYREPAPASVYEPSSYRQTPYKEEDAPPQPYNFEYGISDAYSGANYQAVESQDNQGTVLGSYRVNLPDGRIQTVSYKADNYGGYVADVKYEGEAVYPPEPKEGYGNTASKYTANAPPRYNPAPAPTYVDN